MLTISITFAILVALWGFSAPIAAHVKRAVARAKPATPPVRARRTRAGRPVASA